MAAAFLDADGEYDPAQLESLLEPILAGRADYVVGSRFAGTIDSMLLRRRVGNRVLSATIAHDYNYAQVLTLELLGKGFSYAEVPIRYRWRSHGRSYVRVGRYLRHVLPAMARAARTR